jgi:VanZ family protein
MALLCRQKLGMLSLAIYWPTLFIVSHIPIPLVVRKAEVSDKGLHFLTYLILVFLLWLVLNPDRKVRWRKAGVWWVFLTLIAYGVVDELLQGYLGRSCDIGDLGADVVGIAVGLLLFSLFTFWPAAVVVAGVTIFGLTNIPRGNPAELLPITNTIFGLLSYALFTLLWIRYIQHFDSLRAPKTKWLAAATVLPTAFLLVVRLFSVVLGRDFAVQDVLVSFAGILAAVGAFCLAIIFRKGLTKTQEPSLEDD